MDAKTPSSVASRRLRALAAQMGTNDVSLTTSATSNFESDFTRAKINMATISAERSKARFDVNEMASVIDGGKDKTEVRKWYFHCDQTISGFLSSYTICIASDAVSSCLICLSSGRSL